MSQQFFYARDYVPSRMESWLQFKEHAISECLIDLIKGDSHFQLKEIITLKNEEEHLNYSEGAYNHDQLQEFSNKVSDVVKYDLHILYVKDSTMTMISSSSKEEHKDACYLLAFEFKVAIYNQVCWHSIIPKQNEESQKSLMEID